jgi:hypothetical protein
VANTRLEDRPKATDEQAAEAPRREGFLDPLTQPVQETSPQPQGKTPTDEPISKTPATEANRAWRRLPLPMGERLRETTERNRFLVQIQELEARLAELSAQVQALGGDAGQEMQFYNRHDGGPLDIFSNPIPARTRASVMVIDLKERPGSQVVKLGLFVDQHVKLRLIDNLKLARVEIDTPETIQIAEQSPKELELVAVHPGGAMARLFDDQDRVYKVHADVVSSGTGTMSQKRQALFSRSYAVARTADGSPDRSESVENLTRARYKLPQATAEALAAFVTKHAKSEIEIKVEGETAIVTASPEDQSRIGQFIHLLGPATERRALPDVREGSSGESLLPSVDSSFHQPNSKSPQGLPKLEAKISVQKNPNSAFPLTFLIEVANVGKLPAESVKVVDHYDPMIEYMQATPGYRWSGEDLVWHVDKLEPGQKSQFQFNCKTRQQSGTIQKRVTVTSDEGVTEKAYAALDIKDQPAAAKTATSSTVHVRTKSSSPDRF